MLFNIETDSGNCLTGYIVPDGFSGTPAISVRSRGVELLVLRAGEVRGALVAAGRHETGACGFTLDTTSLPDLPQLHQLELFDVESGVLIYRRARQEIVKKKVLRLETHMFPLWRLDHSLEGRFQYFSIGIEQFGRETVTQQFLLNQIDSVFLSGRILYKSYGYFIESGFQTVAILHDPYEELAERLQVLSKLGQTNSDFLGARDSMVMRAAIEFATALPFNDEKALRRAIRNMPAEAAKALTNPLTRQLTATTPDEMPSGGAVALALDLLASFSLVGLRREATKFTSALVEFLEIDVALPDIVHFPDVRPLAEVLKRMPEIQILLERDLELYHYVVEAFKKAS